MARGFIPQGPRRRKPDAPDVDPKVFLEEVRAAMTRAASCDTLDALGRRVYSKDRSRCHERDMDRTKDQLGELFNRVRCPLEILKGLPCEDFNAYGNTQAARAVYGACRMMRALEHWFDEKATKAVLEYYACFPQPCVNRMKEIAHIGAWKDQLIYWRFRESRSAEELSDLFDKLMKEAEKTDQRYERLRMLPFWNEKDYNAEDVKERAKLLYNRLRQMAHLTDIELQKAGQGQRPPHARKKRPNVKKAVERALKKNPKLKHKPAELAPHVLYELKVVSPDYEPKKYFVKQVGTCLAKIRNAKKK